MDPEQVTVAGTTGAVQQFGAVPPSSELSPQ